ncbi:hypothetical protein B0H15DRAFT_807924 [Mycena belliarum]|uniref:Uncharacterized protein n=1 Tax=Mycena belliarum TaxID=1033014 RepID=A0AAD6TN88_9AGAR|nr:hypothetical protein B0H15DRAFT_807924 [Mycena belliae]
MMSRVASRVARVWAWPEDCAAPNRARRSERKGVVWRTMSGGHTIGERPIERTGASAGLAQDNERWPQDQIPPNRATSGARQVKSHNFVKKGKRSTNHIDGGPEDTANDGFGRNLYCWRVHPILLPFLPPLMPPTRNQRRLRRLSSPFCLPYVLPPSARPIEEEEEDRARMNKEVCALMAAASDAPEGSMEVLEAEHAMDDYEELYGTFIADAENDAWHVRKSEAYGKLVELRARAAECSFNDRVHDLEDYFAAVDAYKTEFDTSFDVEDEWTDSLQLQKLLIRAYHELMLRSNGDLQKASLLAGRRVIPDVVNPFPAGDPRRAELDTKLCQLHAYYHLKEAAPRFQTLHRRRFTFQLPNTYKDQPECELRRRLEYWCHLQIWATDVEGLINNARNRAHLPADAIHSMPPVIFVGKGAAIFNRSTCHFGSRWPIVPVWVTNIEIVRLSHPG